MVLIKTLKIHFYDGRWCKVPTFTGNNDKNDNRSKNEPGNRIDVLAR